MNEQDPDAQKDLGATQASGEQQSDEAPIMAKLVGEARDGQVKDDAPEENGLNENGPVENGLEQNEPEEEIREGSPFAVDPKTSPSQVAAQARKIEKFYDVGPLRYTAMGAVGASAMVIAFAAVACWWFPGGGALIAGLGCALAAFGLFSHLRIPAAACLLVHLSLFVVSYSRILANA